MILFKSLSPPPKNATMPDRQYNYFYNLTSQKLEKNHNLFAFAAAKKKGEEVFWAFFFCLVFLVLSNI